MKNIKLTLFFLMSSSILYCPDPDQVDRDENNPQSVSQTLVISTDSFSLVDAVKNGSKAQFEKILYQRFTNPRQDGWTKEQVFKQLKADNLIKEEKYR